MYGFFRKKRIDKYTQRAEAYVAACYEESAFRFSSNAPDIKLLQETCDIIDIPTSYTLPSSGVRYSLKDPLIVDTDSSDDQSTKQDPYDAAKVSHLLKEYTAKGDGKEVLTSLEQSVNQGFVDSLLWHINKKGLRDSDVYKAAQVDKRLFSKMVSNQEYKPSKDTAIALALALKLSLEEANDLLSRAGYVFSHSNKRDIIIEFFFREQIYKLMDANDILCRLNQKLIGRL